MRTDLKVVGDEIEMRQLDAFRQSGGPGGKGNALQDLMAQGDVWVENAAGEGKVGMSAHPLGWGRVLPS